MKVRSYKQQLRKLLEGLYKLASQSISKNKTPPQDFLLAIKRLQDYEKVLDWLRENGYRVKYGGEVIKMRENNANNIEIKVPNHSEPSTRRIIC